jgi:formate transporter
MAWANGRVTTVQILRNWLIVYLGNFVGAFGLAVLVFLSKQYLFGKGAVGAAALLTANAKSGIGFGEAVALGILCNILVCLAVWMSYSGRTTADKVIAVVPPITAFVACGFEHSIANMYFIPAGLLIKAFASAPFWDQLAVASVDHSALTVGNFLIGNLMPVTIGNIIGGALLVGIVYWFVYLRNRD